MSLKHLVLSELNQSIEFTGGLADLSPCTQLEQIQMCHQHWIIDSDVQIFAKYCRSLTDVDFWNCSGMADVSLVALLKLPNIITLRLCCSD